MKWSLPAKLGKASAPKPFVKASPNPVSAEAEGRTTISWDMGDGSDGVVALVARKLDGDELMGMTGGPSGAKEIDWIRPENRYLFHLYHRADWNQRATVTPQPVAKVNVQRDELTREERYDIALVVLAVGWVLGAASLLVALIVAARRWNRGR